MNTINKDKIGWWNNQLWIITYWKDGSFKSFGPLWQHLELEALFKEADERFMHQLIWGKDKK